MVFMVLKEWKTPFFENTKILSFSKFKNDKFSWFQLKEHFLI